MRSFKTLFLVIAAIVSVLAACRKDTIIPDARARTGGPKSEGCNFDVTIECGMLSFTDAAHLAAVAECLDARQEAILDWLEQEYGSLDDDQFDDAVEQLGYNEDNAIIDFLAGIGFSSYWHVYESALNQFLDAGGLPWEFDMPNPYSTPIAAALRNKFGAVMVGGIIYVALANGNELTFCDCASYEAYLADMENFVLDPNDPCTGMIEKQTYTGSNGFECSDYHKMCHWNGYSSGKNMKVKLIFEHNSEGTFAEARLDSWKRRNNGRWKRHYTKLKPRVYGNENTIECVYRGSFESNPNQRRARTRIANKSWRAMHRTFRNQEVFGSYQWAGGSYSDAITLDWNTSLCWN